MSNRQASRPQHLSNFVPGGQPLPPPPSPSGQYEYGYDDTLDAYPEVAVEEIPVRPKTVTNPDSPFWQNFGKFERIGSTYCWQISFPGRRTPLYGSSKPTGQAEKFDKQQLLKDIIKRIYTKYAQAGFEMKIYRCFTDHEKDNVHLFTLHQTRVIPEPVILGETWLMDWLQHFYSSPVQTYGTELIPKPVPRQTAPPAGRAVIPDKAKQAPPKGPFDESRQFKSEDALWNYAQRLLADGHAQGRVMDFYRTMILKRAPQP